MMRSPRHFEILWESRYGAWAKDIDVLFSRVPGGSSSVWPFRTLGKDEAIKPVRGFLLSVLLHISVFALITQLNFTPGYEPPHTLQASDPTPIYLDMQALKELKILRALPVVKPAGPGGKPGASNQPVRVVLQASTVHHPKLTVVLNPLKPDNNRQAISQKLAPPDLKIQIEQKLPDIVLAEGPAVSRPQVDMSLKPGNNRQAINQKLSPPDLKIQVEQKLPEIVLAEGPAVSRPRVDMSLHQPLARENAQDHSAETAPSVASNAPALSFKIVPTVQQPQLPVSYFTSNSMQAPRAGSSSGGQSGGGASANSSGDPSGGIVVLSVDPGTFSQLASLAQGNRYGAIAIAPSKEGLGSPGGSPNGTSAGGSGGPGKGGDASAGVGPGHSGGGGGGPEAIGNATFSAVGGAGRAGGVDKNKLLGTVLPSTVYAVTSSTKLRRAPLVVSTGPIGGGGLDAYGALHCGKVYTIFLPMPGKSWVLQYCAHQGATGNPEPAKASVVQMEAGLVPPAADQQFDFRRLVVPEKDAEKLIVLRGLIDKDGSTSEVRVFQGVLPEMDAEAALAFSNWKFKPATRASLPISVDVLVGIPARLPEKLNETSSGVLGHQNQ